MIVPKFFNSKKSVNLYGLSENFIFLRNLYKMKIFPKVLMLSGKKGSGKSTLINHLMYSLADGHMEIYVKILPLEEYKEEYKSYEKYQEIIYNKMSAELRLLPNQYPPRFINQVSSSKYGMIKLLNFPFTLGLINTFLGNYYEASHQLLLFIVGYFCHFYYTNNINFFLLFYLSI